MLATIARQVRRLDVAVDILAAVGKRDDMIERSAILERVAAQTDPAAGGPEDHDPGVILADRRAVFSGRDLRVGPGVVAGDVLGMRLAPATARGARWCFY